MTNEEKIATLHQAEDICYDALKEEKNPLNIKYILDALGAVNFELGQLTRHTDSNVVCVPSITPEAPHYDIEEIRAAFVVAHTEKGLDIKSVLSNFGVSKLSDLPEEKYGEVMEVINNA